MNLQDQFANFFSHRLVEQLGSAVGLSPIQAQDAMRAILPRQLDALADLAGNPQTANDLGSLWAGNELNHDPEALLNSPDGLSRLESQGQMLSSRLFGNAGLASSWLSDAAAHAGGNQNAVTRLSHMVLPLLLSFLGRSGVNPQNAASQLVGMRGALSALLPAAAATEVVNTVAARPEVEVREGAPVQAAKPAPAPEPAPRPEPRPAPVPPPPPEKSGFNPLWLLLPLLLGLWWFLRPHDEPVTTTSQATTSAVTNSEAATSEATTSEAATTSATDEGIVVANVNDRAELPLEPFVLTGTAPIGDTVTITNAEGKTLGSDDADDKGFWGIQMPAPVEGENAYTVTGAPSNAVSNFTVIGKEGAAPAAASEAATSDAATAATSEAATAAVPVTITEPTEGATVPAETFNIVGEGQPNARYGVYEDGVNVATVFADKAGKWTADVTAATAGDHTYVVLDEAGNQVATLPLVVAEPVASNGCAANTALNLSLANGDSVSAPFRFGGIGGAKSYTVRVFRGDEQIGEKQVTPGANCAWSYLSEPGGKEGEVGEITYEVVPEGSDTAGTRITLNVLQSGANFENGQYVGPTTRPV